MKRTTTKRAESDRVKADAGRRSKIEPFRDLVGQVPDREIAEKAGVSVEGVRQYRRRHGIALTGGRRRGSGRSAETASAGRRKSRLDPYAELVGTVPDREIAAMADVTPENVRAYRKRRGIAAKWGRTTPAEVEETPTVEVAEAPVAAPAPAPAPVAASRPETGLHGYEVKVQLGDEYTDYVIVASDIAKAAANARNEILARAAAASITAIRHLGPALR